MFRPIDGRVLFYLSQRYNISSQKTFYWLGLQMGKTGRFSLLHEFTLAYFNQKLIPAQAIESTISATSLHKHNNLNQKKHRRCRIVELDIFVTCYTTKYALASFYKWQLILLVYFNDPPSAIFPAHKKKRIRPLTTVRTEWQYKALS